MIAALYVQTNGCYFGLDGVDPWDEKRDARTYAGPHPVVAHPPCERWGRYATGGPSAKTKRIKGNDGGCFMSAIHAVRMFGGVLEHPAHSTAFAWAGIGKTQLARVPSSLSGWVRADDFGGFMCQVEQGHYGHRARKATWLYAIRCKLPALTWGPAASSARLDDGFHSKAERAAAVAAGWKPSGTRLTAAENIQTPTAFRDILLEMARSVTPR